MVCSRFCWHPSTRMAQKRCRWSTSPCSCTFWGRRAEHPYGTEGCPGALRRGGEEQAFLGSCTSQEAAWGETLLLSWGLDM